MSQVEIDDDLLELLNTMRKGNETINDVLRRVLLSIDKTSAHSVNYVTKEEFNKKSDEILEKYHDLLVRLAE